MPLPDIKLDDRRFEDILADARRRIPGYTPEWTDQNDSDPGITLLQLFAWLTDMILWRMNRVPEKSYLKFLELIGLAPRLPTPAHADVMFHVVPGPGKARLVAQGTQIALADQVDGAPVVFETDDNFYAVDSEIKGLQSYDGARFELLDAAHRVEGRYFYPLSAQPQRNAAFYVGFSNPLPTDQPVPLTFNAYTAGLIAEGGGIEATSPPIADPEINEEETRFATTRKSALATPPPVAGVWEYWAGDALAWRPVDVKSDTTNALTRTGCVTLKPPEAPAWVAAKKGLMRTDDAPLLYWLRFRIDQLLGRGYEIAPRLEDALLNTIGATNASTVRDELLGASNGRANQVFTLANAPVLPEPFVLEVDEGEGFRPWTRVRNFGASQRGDRHFIVDFATGRVLFGDGEHGRIPARRFERERPEEDLANVRVRLYRWGGGARGNAGAHKLTSLRTAVPYIDKVDNLRPAVGGQDEESVTDIKARAPDYLRTRSRAVTAADFEFLARQTPGARIRRARAMPLRHPQFAPVRPAGGGLPATSAGVPGVVTVIVVPEALDATPNPLPSEETLAHVAAWLDAHRTITTELFVVAPRYRKVEVSIDVTVADSASSGDVQRALGKMLDDYFHPLRGGDGQGWEFGGTISFAEIFRRILDTDGVKSLDGGAVTIFVDGVRIPPCTDVPLDAGELTCSGEHRVVAHYAGR